MIPTYLWPYDNEATFSWLYRMALANGYDNSSFYIQNYVHDTKMSARDRCPHYDGLGAIYRPYRDTADSVSFGYQLFRATSLYQGIAPLLSAYQQSAVINSVFNPIAGQCSLIHPLQADMCQKPRICPECAKLEASQGLPLIYHRTHQMPGVHVCSKHHCLLQIYTGKRGSEFTDKEAFTSAGEYTASGDAYAVFAEDFLRAALPMSLEDTVALLLHKIRDGLPSSHPLYNQKIDTMLIHCKARPGHYVHSLDVAATLTALFILYGSVSEIRKSLPNNMTEKMNFLKLLRRRNYTLVSEYYPPAMILHDDTGADFISTEALLLDGWESPSRMQGMNDDKIFRHLVEVQTNGAYALLSSYAGLHSPVTLRHIQCGRNITVTAAAFLDRKTRCQCGAKTQEREYVEQKLKDTDLSEKFEFLQYTNIRNGCIVRCKRCGTVMHFPRLAHFLAKPCCINCEPERYNKKGQVSYRVNGEVF